MTTFRRLARISFFLFSMLAVLSNGPKLAADEESPGSGFVEVMTKAADGGDVEACEYLGMFLAIRLKMELELFSEDTALEPAPQERENPNATEYLEKCIHYLKKAGELGSITAYEYLALHYEKGVLWPKDVEKVRHYRELAEQIDTGEALFRRGEAEMKDITPESHEETMRVMMKHKDNILKSADLGYLPAQVVASQILLNPRFGRVDKAKSQHYTILAAKQGDTDALTRIATTLMEQRPFREITNLTELEALFRKYGDMTDPRIQGGLGQTMLLLEIKSGGLVRTKRTDEAVELIRQSIKGGNTGAEGTLAMLPPSITETDSDLKNKKEDGDSNTDPKFLKARKLFYQDLTDYLYNTSKFQGSWLDRIIAAIEPLQQRTEEGDLGAAKLLSKSSFYTENYDYAITYLQRVVSGGDLSYIEELKAYFEAGGKEAAYLLFPYYSYMSGEANLDVMAPYLEAAAEYGFPDAQFSAGMLFKRGDIFDKNLVKAEKYFRMAVKKEHLPSMFSLAQLLMQKERGEAEAIKLLEDASDKGCMVSPMYLAEYYIKKNPKKSRAWMKVAADAGNAFANHVIGELYYKNRQERDFALAYKHFNKASETGYPEAQARLAEMYEKGLYAVQDYVEAYKWLNIAISNSSKMEELKDLPKRRDKLMKKNDC